MVLVMDLKICKALACVVESTLNDPIRRQGTSHFEKTDCLIGSKHIFRSVKYNLHCQNQDNISH